MKNLTTWVLPVLLVFCMSLAVVSGSCQNYSAAYFKNHPVKKVENKILYQKHITSGFYVKVARELLGSDFVVTNAAGVMVLMGTFYNDSFTFDRKLFSKINKQDYFLSVFRDNKQLASEKLNL